MIDILTVFFELLSAVTCIFALILIPVVISFLFGWIRGNDMAFEEKCELCKSLEGLEQAYADYGRSVFEFIHGLENLEKRKVDVSEVWNHPGFPKAPDEIKGESNV